MSNESALVFQSTKTYPHSLGLSAAFRQWKAQSHCKFLHGYSLQVELVFRADELDRRNWVVDFGGLKSLKSMLEDTFDHKTIVAEDDPNMDWFREGHRKGVIDMVVVPATGCERFAEMIFTVTEQWLIDAGFSPRCKLVSVKVSEHEGNAAIVSRRMS